MGVLPPMESDFWLNVLNSENPDRDFYPGPIHA